MLHICLKLVQTLQLANQLLCVDKAEDICLDGDLMDVIADGGELSHRIIETVVWLLLRLIATEQQTDERRFRQAGFLGFFCKSCASSRENQNCFLIVLFINGLHPFSWNVCVFLHGVLGVPLTRTFFGALKKRSKKALLVKLS